MRVDFSQTEDNLQSSIKLLQTLMLDLNSRCLYEHFEKSGTRAFAFLSREGEPLKEAFETWINVNNKKDAPKCIFVQTSRRCLNRYLVGKDNFEARFVVNELYEGPVSDFLGARLGLKKIELAKVFSDKELSELIPYGDRMIMNELVEKTADYFKANPLSDVSLGEDYLKNRVDATTTIVDIGFKGTMQESISKILRIPINGFYFGLSNRAWKTNRKDAVFLEKDHREVFNNTILLEYLCSTDNGTTVAYEKINNEVIPKIVANSEDATVRVDNKHLAIEFAKRVSFSTQELQELFLAYLLQFSRKASEDFERLKKRLSIEDEWSSQLGMTEVF